MIQIFMRCRITQSTERVQLIQCLFAQIRFKILRFVNDDINLQVASLNNQLKILQSQEIKHQAIETSLEQIHEETITQMQQQL